MFALAIMAAAGSGGPDGKKISCADWSRMARLDGESEPAYAARRAHCQLPAAERSVAAAYRAIKGEPPDSTLRAPGHFHRWAKKFDWPGSASRWDTYMVALPAEPAGEELAAIRRPGRTRRGRARGLNRTATCPDLDARAKLPGWARIPARPCNQTTPANTVQTRPTPRTRKDLQVPPAGRSESSPRFDPDKRKRVRPSSPFCTLLGIRPPTPAKPGTGAGRHRQNGRAIAPHRSLGRRGRTACEFQRQVEG